MPPSLIVFSPDLPPKVRIKTGETLQSLDSLTALTARVVFSKGEGIKPGCAVTQKHFQMSSLWLLQMTHAAY